MYISTVTPSGNKDPSERLKGMLADLRSNVSIIVEGIKEIRQQAKSEGFEEHEIHSLLRHYLSKFLSQNQIRYLLYWKPRRAVQKKLTDKAVTCHTDANMSIDKEPETETVSIPTDYNVVIPEHVLEEGIKQLEQQEQQKGAEPINEVFEEPKPDHGEEELRAELEDAKRLLAREREGRRQAKEKIEQLEAKTRGISPSNGIPAVEGNMLRIKVVVNPLFRDVIRLKGKKVIYANVVIDVSQNKYIGLEPLYAC
jgi:hypothetical protein